MERTLTRALVPTAIVLSLLTLAPALAENPGDFTWNDGDRVVLIGDTLIERDQTYGFLETRITAENPDKAITFRNLGWSGDTVRGLSRAGFGPPADGFTQLKGHVLALKPTVLIVGYGMSESFEGERGLASFESGLNGLLDTFAPLKARLILLSPIAHENLGPPLPDPAKHNASLEQYRDAIEAVARERHARFVDLFTPFRSAKAPGLAPLTDDGLHPTARGAWFLARVIDRSLRPSGQDTAALVSIGAGKAHKSVTNLKTADTTVTFDVTRATLPAPVPPEPGGKPTAPGASPSVVRVSNLPAGEYALAVDGKAVASADAKGWAEGVDIESGPDFDQVEALRAAINDKNRLYFYRWRPQNETYLFGFRKHEQGNNAREIPLFDPLVDEKERAIAELKVPSTHHYNVSIKN